MEDLDQGLKHGEGDERRGDGHAEKGDGEPKSGECAVRELRTVVVDVGHVCEAGLGCLGVFTAKGDGEQAGFGGVGEDGCGSLAAFEASQPGLDALCQGGLVQDGNCMSECLADVLAGANEERTESAEVTPGVELD